MLIQSTGFKNALMNSLEELYQELLKLGYDCPPYNDDTAQQRGDLLIFVTPYIILVKLSTMACGMQLLHVLISIILHQYMEPSIWTDLVISGITCLSTTNPICNCFQMFWKVQKRSSLIAVLEQRFDLDGKFTRWGSLFPTSKNKFMMQWSVWRQNATLYSIDG